MSFALRLLFALLVGACGASIQAAASNRPNVLFIAADDLNDWVGVLGGHRQVQTPRIDGLAAAGTLFANAHCQAPLCNPSRVSLLFGLRPSTTGIYGLAPGPRRVEALRGRMSLPQAFGRAGYHTFTCGKIWHDGSLARDEMLAEFKVVGPAPGMPKPTKPFSKLPATNPLVDWGEFPEDDRDQADWKIAAAAVDAIRRAPTNQPFFIACGFRLPHVPCYASTKWFELYPERAVQLPPVRASDRDDTPRFSWYLHWRLPEPRLQQLQKHDEWGALVRAYLASVSFMDSQVGRVLDALKESGRERETIVVFWSDHGWHLGEKLITGKNTLWERSTRVPLIFSGPGSRAGGRCAEPVELLDVYPTLVELCGLERVAGLDGLSLRPQLSDQRAPRPRPAVTTHNPGNHAVRDTRWRYIRYADHSEELYDLQNDPNEWTNLAAQPQHAATIVRLAQWLPRADAPPAPGSAHRVLTRDEKSGAWLWEGGVIAENDPVPGLDD